MATDALARAFLEFHTQNPQVYHELKALALQLRNAGHEVYGIKALFEVVRFHRSLQTTDPHFKLNNNYTAFYSRLLMANEPDLAGFFKTRHQRRQPA